MPSPLKNLPSSLSASKPTGQYRAMCPLAVVSIALGALSIITILTESVASWLLASLVPVGGAVAGWMAIKQINRAPNEWLGRRLAQAGIVVSIVMWLSASATAWWLSSRVPSGYQPITFETLWPNPTSNSRLIPQAVRDMQDKKIFLQGYMQPRRMQTGIKDFVLVPTSGECPFCPNPTQAQMLRINLQGDAVTNFTTHLIGVAGRLQIQEDHPSGIPFAIEADLLR